MMRVATSLVIVALLTAAVTAARMKSQQEGSNSEDGSCIETFIDLEESLVKRNSNINHLHNAFFPSNQQVPAVVDLLVHFSTSLQNTSHKLCNPSTARLDNHTSDYKFRWSASATLLFVKPEILRPLSVFVYRGVVTTAEVVIDPMCADLDSEDQQMEGKVCKESTNEEKPEELLNKLCIHLKSYVAGKENEALNGYCLYYFNHTDPHLLDDSTEDTLQQIFLSIAIIFLWLAIAISVPAALYSEIQIKTGEKSTNEQNSSTAEQGSTNEQGSTTKTANKWKTETIKPLRAIRKALAKTRESNDVYSILAVFTIAPLLDVTIIGLNVWLLVNYKMTWFILCIDAVFIALSTFEVVWVAALAWHNRDELDKLRTCVLYAAGIYSLVVALQLLTFHGTFILLVFIFSPIPTACFTLIYISALFSIVSAVSIVIKVIHRCREKKVRDKKCHYAFQITGAILLAFCVLSFDALFFITLMRARLDNFGISGFFGALVPTAIIALISFIGNKLIGENHVESNNENSNTGDRDRPTDQTNTGHFRYLQSSNKKSNTGDRDRPTDQTNTGHFRYLQSSNKKSNTGDRDRPTDQTNTGHFRYVQSSNKKSNTGEIDEEERVIENPGAQTA